MTTAERDPAWFPLQRLLPIAARLVPAGKRQDWLREWEAELWHLAGRAAGRAADSAGSRSPAITRDVLSLGYGIVADAGCLGLDALRDKARASAYTSLWILAAYCLFCASAERITEGSWCSALNAVSTHFLGLFVYVAVPAVFASIATYPLRTLRSHAQHARGASRLSGRLSIRARWNLFLAAKTALTLAVAFLVSLVAVGPVHMVLGPYSDWFELALYAITVTGGMRWALLNQEQRCQKCLRMLSQPTRVGPASRNFLDWSGTELACADGHGLLHVPEMQGSWCWYDLWLDQDLDQDPVWRGLFGS